MPFDYTSDGRIPIDNNRVEQLMKQVALGRKAWLFVGNVAAGEQSAMMMSLVSSARRHDVDVWLYLKDVLDQLLQDRRTIKACCPMLGSKTIPKPSEPTEPKNAATKPIESNIGPLNVACSPSAKIASPRVILPMALLGAYLEVQTCSHPLREFRGLFEAFRAGFCGFLQTATPMVPGFLK